MLKAKSKVPNNPVVIGNRDENLTTISIDPPTYFTTLKVFGNVNVGGLCGGSVMATGCICAQGDYERNSGGNKFVANANLSRDECDIICDIICE